MSTFDLLYVATDNPISTKDLKLVTPWARSNGISLPTVVTRALNSAKSRYGFRMAPDPPACFNLCQALRAARPLALRSVGFRVALVTYAASMAAKVVTIALVLVVF